jgi:hypothetical protein
MTPTGPGLRQQGTIRNISRFLGPVMALAGAYFVGLAVHDLITADGFEAPGKFWMVFVGLLLIFVGLVLGQVGFLGMWLGNVASETPVVPATVAYVGDKAEAEADPRWCTDCGASNTAEARFCSSCGVELPALPA